MRQHLRACSILFILLFITVRCGFAEAAPTQVFYVSSLTDDGHGSLRSCVEAANKSFGRSEIILSKGVHVISSHLELRGDVAIVGRGSVSAVTGAGHDRVFVIDQHAHASFYNVKVVDGGILNFGQLSMVKCDVSSTYGAESTSIVYRAGGGIYNAGAMSLLLCTVSDNFAGSALPNSDGADGGGIYNAGTGVITCCTVIGNGAGVGDRIGGVASNGGDGGGIYNRGKLLIERSTIAGNGAGWAAGGPGMLPDKFSAGGSGGGLFNAGTIIINNSTISGNAAGNGEYDGGLFGQIAAVDGGDGGNGGGIFNAGPARLTSCTIAFNGAGQGGSGYGATIAVAGTPQKGIGGHGGCGGGIFSTNATLELRNTIVAQNSAGAGGAGGTTLSWLLSTTLITSREEADIRAPNGSAGTSPDITGQIHSGGYNLITIVDDLNSPWIDHDIVSDGTLFGGPLILDAGLLPLSMNGGPTPTHALSNTSHAAHSGNAFGLKIDQRGYPRIHHLDFSAPGWNPNLPSIGAYQWQPENPSWPPFQ